MNFDAFYEHLLLYGTIQEFIKIMCKQEDIQTLWLEDGLWIVGSVHKLTVPPYSGI